jgi:surface carbohydrate biosynthesis protein
MRVLYCSCEVGKRETLSRAYLAGALASRGVITFVGSKLFFDPYLALLPRGLYFYKSVTKVCGPRYREVKQHGHITAGVCEETLVFENAESPYPIEDQIDPSTLSDVDLFLASNPLDEELASGVAGKTKFHGNIRLHFAKNAAAETFDRERSRIRDLHGEYYLVNSPGIFVFSHRSVSHEMGHYQNLRHLKQSLSGVLAEYLLRDLEILSNIDAIGGNGGRWLVRPHPHEDKFAYKSVFGLPEDLIADAHEFFPWSLSATKTYGFNCTTEIEAILSGIDYENLSRRPEPWTIFGSLEKLEASNKKHYLERHFNLSDDHFLRYKDVFFDHIPNNSSSFNEFKKLLSAIIKHQRDYVKLCEKNHPKILERWLVAERGREEVILRAVNAGYHSEGKAPSDQSPKILFLSTLGYVILPGALADSLIDPTR